jgi:hypothetical protein
MTRLGRGVLRAALPLLFAAGAMTPAAATARPLRHVRIVLDISRSMIDNDRDRLATLSTVLLQDLVDPNPSLGDSFEVIPFDPKMSWKDGPPPTTVGRRVRFEQDHREAFAKALHDLPYDGQSTYYYPGLKAAVEDLEKAPGDEADIKNVVLVTDGVPLKEKLDIEAKLIASELQPRMLKAGIRFYILAFGSEAKTHEAYLSGLVTTPTGPLGVAIVDADGRELLGSMLKIFSRSFGYSPDASQTLPGPPSLDLEAQTTPEKVAVVVVARRPAPLPSLTLTPPTGGRLNLQGGVRTASAAGASYSLLWVLTPSKGNYGFGSDANPGSVAVLRPVRLALEILPAPPRTRQTARTMATTPFPLRVLVRNPSGAGGVTAQVDLAIRPLGERRGSAFSWQGDWFGPRGPSSALPEGRVYDISPEFPENREAKGQIYTGHLEVLAKSGEAEVGALKDDHAHPIEVHPFLSIAPSPLAAYAAERALARHEERCTRFSLVLESGKQLPHPERSEYPVQALLEAAPTLLDHELHEATFLLDDRALEPAGRPAPQIGEWRQGRTLTGGELLGPHTVCVHIGRPTAGDHGQVLELTVAFTLREDPYDDFHVVKPFLLKVLVEPPGFVERWRAYLWGSFALLALLAALWYLRDRPVLPPDLRCTVGRESGAAVADALGEPTFGSRFLGLADERPVVAPGEDRLLGRVQAADEELFRFRPTRGMTVEPLTGGERLTTLAGVLAVHRTYRLHTPDGAYTLRLEYR